jgi:hypothetical protein
MAEFALPAGPAYPVRFDVDYPERQSRWKALFRIVLAIPVLLYAGIMSWALYGVVWLFWLIVLLRGRSPRWLFEFMVATSRGIARSQAYLYLLTDAYPPFEGAHAAHLDVRYPERIARRKLIVWKLLTSIPHFVVMQALTAAALAVIAIAWFAIIFGQQFPKGLHRFVTGLLRWQARVYAYVISLTDEFPPYSTSAEAGPGSRRAMWLSALGGAIVVGLAIAGITAGVIYAIRNAEQEISVSYDRLVSGEVLPFETTVFGDGMVIALTSAHDPADAELPFLDAEEGKHLVGFEMQVQDTRERDLWIYNEDFQLEDGKGRKRGPFLALVNKRPLPQKIEDGAEANIELVFEVNDDALPWKLRYDVAYRRLRILTYVFD